MTATELYDMAVVRYGADTCVWSMDGRYVVGTWVPLGACIDGLVLSTSCRGVRVIGEGATLDEAAARAGLP